MAQSDLPRTIWWEVDENTKKGGVYLIDQTRMPLQGDILCCSAFEGVAMAISSFAIQGSGALALAASFALAVWSQNESQESETEAYLKALDGKAAQISALRPGTCALAWGAARILGYAHSHAQLELSQIKKGVLELACRLVEEDEAACLAMGEKGAELFAGREIHENAQGEPEGGVRILTLGNAGSLSAARYGTVCSVVCALEKNNRLAQAWVCETRPGNTGARLATWEYMVCGIPHALISDACAASVMAKGWVDAVMVGADLICANGDVIACTGSYSLALLAKAHGIPFYVVANSNTIDPSTPDGASALIESRDGRELEGCPFSGVILPDDMACSRGFDLLTDKGEHVQNGERLLQLKGGHQMAISKKGGAYAFDAWMRNTPNGVLAYNPAFDMTPACFVTAVISQDSVGAVCIESKGQQ